MRLAHPGEETAEIRNPNLEILTASRMPFQGSAPPASATPKSLPCNQFRFRIFQLEKSSTPLGMTFNEASSTPNWTLGVERLLKGSVSDFDLRISDFPS
jgi:hypothetical protein